MKPARLSFVLAALALSGVASFSTYAGAHILVSEPEPRVPGAQDLKTTPCGQGRSWGDGTVHMAAPGDTITIEWTETITHAGYYRVALGMTGDSALAIPTEADYEAYTAYYQSGSGDLPAEVASPTTPQADGDLLVYYDHWASHDSGECVEGTDGAQGCELSVTITLPMQTCEQCTLQIVQTMAESFRTYGSDAHYYQCIDLTIEGDVGGGTGGASAVGGGGMGGESLVAGGAGGMPQGGAPTMSGGGMSGGGMVMGMAGMPTMQPMGGAPTTPVPMGMAGTTTVPTVSSGGATAGGGAAPTGVVTTAGAGAGAPGAGPMSATGATSGGGCTLGVSVNRTRGALGIAALMVLGVGLARRRRS